MAEKNQTKVPEFMSTHPSGDTRIESLVSQFPTTLAYFNEASAKGKAPTCQR
jgi:predicted Zn-dependent protease